MKRVLPYIISLFLVFSLCLTGCGPKQADRNQVLNDLLDSTRASLDEEFGKTCNFMMLEDYLDSWADSNGVSIEKKDDHYMVLLNKASGGKEKAKTTVLQCSVDPADTEHDFSVLSSGLTALFGPDPHGQISLIITEESNGERIGAASIDSKYLKCDNFINLSAGSSESVYLNGAESLTCTISSKAKPAKPDFDNAFNITMTIPEYTDPFHFEKGENYPDPVETIGNLLASAKSSGKLFEVASFTCEKHEGYAPYSASAVLVIDQNNVEAIKKKFEKSSENIRSKVKKMPGDVTYTMNETEMPEKVLNSKVTDNLVSLMYTLNTGICSQDEDNIYSASYISSVSTKNGKLKLKIKIRAKGSDDMALLCDEYSTTAALCSADFSCDKEKLTWTSDTSGQLFGFFNDGDSETVDAKAIAIRSLDNDILSASRPGLNIISYSFGEGDCFKAVKKLCTFMSALQR